MKCSPEYNEQTKKMMRDLAELRRVDAALESGDFGSVIRAKAKAMVELGESDTGKIVDAAHRYVNQFAEHSKEEVANEISGYGKERKPTTDPVQQRLNALNAELRDLQRAHDELTGKTDPDAKAKRARETGLRNQIAEITRKLEYGDQAAEKRSPLSNAEIERLKADRDALNKELDQNTNPPPAIYPKDLNEAKNRAEQTRLKNELADLDKRIASLDTSEKVGHTYKPSAETLRLREERKAKAKEFDNLKPAGEAIYPKDPSVQRNQARQRQLENQIAALQDKIAKGDMSKPEKRAEYQYNEKTQAARLERDRLKRQVDTLIQKGERMHQSTPKRILDVAHAVQMFNLFTSYMVHPKLMAAVLGGHVLATAQAATISIAKLIPAINRLALISERQGAGLTVGGLKERYVRGVAAAPKAAGESFTHGHSMLEAAHGEVARASDAYWGVQGTLAEALNTPGLKNKILESSQILLSYPGRTHGMIKQFLSTPEFYQSYFDRSLQIQKQMKAKGHSPEEIQEFLGRETTQATIGAKALMDAYESKMQGKNRINDVVVGAINRLSNSDKFTENVVGFAAKTILPVARVGPNVFKQGTSLMAGGVKAAIEASAKKEMTPERADYILKNIGQQGAGLGLFMALGAVYYNMFGGIPGAGKKVQKDAEGNPIKPDEADIAGIPVGAWGFHGAPFAMLQMGAGIRRLFEQEQGKGKDVTDAALTAIGSNLWNWTERTIPEFDVVRRAANTLEWGRGKGKYGSPWGELLGNQLRSMIEPLALQQYAQQQDPYKKFRKPRNLEQDLKLGIPGERETVPTR